MQLDMTQISLSMFLASSTSSSDAIYSDTKSVAVHAAIIGPSFPPAALAYFWAAASVGATPPQAELAALSF